MISVCAPNFDIDGQVISHAGAAVAKNVSRRAKRVATLDMSAVQVDGGYSVADLTYDLQLPDVSGEHHLAMTNLISNHKQAVLSCQRGCYLVLLSALDYRRGLTTCTAEVLEDLG